MVALGIWLPCRQPLVLATLVLAACGAVGSGVFALEARPGAAAHVPTIATETAAWSVGIMLAFCGSLHAIPGDARQGVLALVWARGMRARDYAFGRTIGLSAVVGAAVGGVALVSGICAVSVSSPLLPALRATFGSLAYCTVFAATISPVAMAALGVDSRVAGYLSLLAVLVLPEVAAPSTSTILPSGWNELTSIPAALAAIRAGVESPSAYGSHAVRALALLAALGAVSLAIVRARAARQQAKLLA